MILFPDGDDALSAIKRPLLRPIFLLLLILSALLLSGCGSRVASTNWPGLSTDGEKLYLANGPAVRVFNADDQTLAWQYPAQDDVSASLQFYAAPSVQENRVIFGDYGASGQIWNPRVTVSVYARENVDNGGTPPETPGWTSSEVAFDKIVAPPLQVGDVVYVGTADNLMLALDADTGLPVWDQPFEAGHSIWGQASYKAGTLYFTSLDRHLYALDAQTGTELWATEFEGAVASRPVLNEDLVYVGEFGSKVDAVDRLSGAVKWTAPAENWVWGAPAYADGAVYYADIDGNVYAVDALTGEQKWQAAAPGAVQTQPLVLDGRVYVASEGEASDVPAGALTAFDAASGAQVWRQLTPAPLFTAPVAVDNAVIVAMQSESTIMSAFDLETGAPMWNIAPPVEG
jgi:outer membrane protein assembly factor BamB